MGYIHKKLPCRPQRGVYTKKLVQNTPIIQESGVQKFNFSSYTPQHLYTALFFLNNLEDKELEII